MTTKLNRTPERAEGARFPLRNCFSRARSAHRMPSCWRTIGDAHDAGGRDRHTGQGKASLQPNGLHIMMFGLKTRPAAGDTINVTLRLDDGTSVPVAATVRKQEAKHAPTYGLSCRFWRSKLSSGGVTSPAGWRRFRTYRRQRPAL